MSAGRVTMDAEGNRVPEPVGDPACLLSRVCPECGAVPDGPPPEVCPRCGAEMPERDGGW
ncbi:hypothetical protein ACIGNX_28385 [Actinosynnema sp. NPDC053489]|uniref:hypothetical protein n=1 Tax=Actinosynnema sp. NPDC053489 TaxID=3363916 RepID=UPI0037CC0329